MEEPGNPIRFDQTPYTNFYMCRSCTNHVLSSENILFENRCKQIIICQNPVNVGEEVVESGRLLIIRRPMVNVSCNDCRKLVSSDGVVQEGRFIFYLSRLLNWNGMQLVYADIKQQVEHNLLRQNSSQNRT
ncbi:hypothetical protein DITRI_Ditri13aG0156600 [Diplodiscus trichospermus]